MMTRARRRREVIPVGIGGGAHVPMTRTVGKKIEGIEIHRVVDLTKKSAAAAIVHHVLMTAAVVETQEAMIAPILRIDGGIDDAGIA